MKTIAELNTKINHIFEGDCIETMKLMPDKSVNCCVTSPPYYGLRDYGHEGQIGLEETPEQFVSKLVDVFREVKRVLKNDGTLWLNLGDSYASNTKGSGGPSKKQDSNAGSRYESKKFNHGVKEKDLIGIPWMVAFALRADGWYLRQDIIWHKPNPMPESVTDRCTKSHEYIFLLSKSAKYYYDHEAIKQDSIEPIRAREKNNGESAVDTKMRGHDGNCGNDGTANKRSVWTVTTKPYSEAHFATYPEDLIVDCIKAGCPEFVCSKCGKARENIMSKSGYNPDVVEDGERFVDKSRGDKTRKLSGAEYNKAPKAEIIGLTDCGCNEPFEPGVVLDTFGGSGTTALVARKLHRNYILCELNPEYIRIAKNRLQSTLGMFV